MPGTDPNGSGAQARRWDCRAPCPALAVRGSNLYCAIRGHDSNIWFAGFDGAGWGGFQKAPTVITLTAPAITAPNTDDLYFAYGSADF
ncbi:hypothetical protein [Streptomyces lydicamycinicus]|uniref:hypothetical protein n=1 Tax=Streptomyces lydicamycinicus TaxID=1546107 RepID=UPI003C2B101A